MKFFSLIYEGDVHTSTDEKVIRASDYSALLTAEEILTLAKEEIAKLREEEKIACEKLREEAVEDGFQVGLEQFNKHMIAFDLQLKQLQHEVNRQVLPLALKAAKKIVGKELETHPEAIVDIVLQTIAPITQSKRVKIYINKADREILEKERSKIKEVFEHIDTLSILDRSDISPGGCIIETESGIINASIENQWRALESAFEKYMKQ